jgi:hypothetical protein
MDRREPLLMFLRFNPEYDDVRNDSRFQALVACLKLPD